MGTGERDIIVVMSEAPPIRRRWFRCSLRTMFVVVTVFAVWLTHQINFVKHRKVMLGLIKERGGGYRALSDWPLHPYLGEPPKVSIPFWRRWMGDEPITDIAWPSSTTRLHVIEAHGAFPESRTQYRRRNAATIGDQPG
jgi:hypothetical protein